MKKLLAILVFFLVHGELANAQGQVVRQDVEGIVNFAQIESTVACAGAISPESVTQIRDMGFRSIINLRLASEEGANVETEAAAADAAGIKYVHLPFGGETLDPTVADRFLVTITEPDTSPAFIHCAGGGRASMMWFIKRVVVDGWEIDTAFEEAAALGLSETGPGRAFALDYIAARAQ